MTITTPETEIPDEEQLLVLISFDTCLHQMTMTAQEFAFASRSMAGKRDYFLCRDCAARKRGACEFTPLKHAAIITWLAGPPSPRK